jgi:prolyl-tRNA synthetase
MVHADDDGMVIPPKLAQVPVIAIPITKKNDDSSRVLETLQQIVKDIRAKGIAVKVDDRDNVSPGFKFAEAELFGYPLRIELGPRDLEAGQLTITMRHSREKITLPLERVAAEVPLLLTRMQAELFNVAKNRMTENTHEVNSYSEFKEYIAADRGFALCHWAGSTADEKRIQEETKATLRVIPMEGRRETGSCFLTGKESAQRVIFSKAY